MAHGTESQGDCWIGEGSTAGHGYMWALVWEKSAVQYVVYQYQFSCLTIVKALAKAKPPTEPGGSPEQISPMCWFIIPGCSILWHLYIKTCFHILEVVTRKQGELVSWPARFKYFCLKMTQNSVALILLAISSQYGQTCLASRGQGSTIFCLFKSRREPDVGDHLYCLPHCLA